MLISPYPLKIKLRQYPAPPSLPINVSTRFTPFYILFFYFFAPDGFNYIKSMILIIKHIEKS
jgi:hypothetical protein